jgi:hypothetical protein
VRICEVVSLAKAPTDSVTPTTKLARPFHCLVERVESADRQLFQFRRRYSEGFGSIAPASTRALGPWAKFPVASALGGQRGGPTAGCARSLTSCPDSEERTGIRFEKERVYGYSGGAKALPGGPLAPAIAPIRGSRR